MVVGRLGIGTDVSGNHSAVRTPQRQLCGPERPILFCTACGPLGSVLCFLIRPRAFLSLCLSAVRFDRSFASASAGEGIMAAAVSSVSVLPLAPLRPLPLRRAARNVLEGRVRRASSPLLLARHDGLRRGRPAAAAAAVAGEAELPLEEAEAAMRVAADDDSITATVVSVLLTVAFVGLSLLTLGVIYLAVQDFLQKREKEKFEKEEAERQKEEARKKRAKSRQKRRNY
ncbi:uncharacterized protein LOC8081515 [Sorghum bicolor]|nr:uncharacterized protein LOC8081515 [Sorghum bicolor]XP_021320476.1 uncharacterized protein LOC8081515 [Sorghum bicolor]XP_021320483.1 uncharacterized protein LOC8081515 [Sorghum bicolor]|eukprot:XP_002468112.2 uncharacterized protein LOC8081515 [Sorghum bicolor]